MTLLQRHGCRPSNGTGIGPTDCGGCLGCLTSIATGVGSSFLAKGDRPEANTKDACIKDCNQLERHLIIVATIFVRLPRSQMLNVFLTVDVEIWCNGWTGIDAKFSEAFQRYVYGRTDRGEFGLRYQANLLKEHGLNGVFFVEPLFSGRFGLEPLTEIVGLLREREQEIQLHLHTEWVDEWPTQLFPGGRGKRQFLHLFPRDEQRLLIADGMRRLEQAGANPVNCFRAGSFGFNADTLDALAACDIPFDSSYNATAFGRDSGIATGTIVTDVHFERGVTEYPLTVYDTGFGRLRHAQLGACSSAELELLLWAALEKGRQSFVILSHSFELLTPAKTQPDSVVVLRYQKLCRFLDRHRDSFSVRGFHGLHHAPAVSQPAPLRSSAWLSALRTVEQLYRRRHR